MEENGHDGGDDEEEDEGHGDGAGALAGGEEFESAEIAVAEALGLVVGEVASGAAVEEKSAECDDEGLELELGDEEAVGEAEEEDAEGGEEEGEGPGHVGEEHAEDDALEGEDGADGEVDAGGDDDHAGADGEDAEEADEGGEVLEVFLAEEGAGLEGCDDAADEEEKEAEADFFFMGSVSDFKEGAGCWREHCARRRRRALRKRPTARVMTASSEN